MSGGSKSWTPECNALSWKHEALQGHPHRCNNPDAAVLTRPPVNMVAAVGLDGIT